MNRETRKALSMLMAGGVLMSCMSVTALADEPPGQQEQTPQQGQTEQAFKHAWNDCPDCDDGMVLCPVCEGVWEQCSVCKGKGEVQVDDHGEFCETCNGRGKGVRETCPYCMGEGCEKCGDTGTVLRRCTGFGTTHCDEGKVNCETCNGRTMVECTGTLNTSTNKEATCTEAGELYRICPKCTESDTVPIPALGHEYENGVCKRCNAPENGEGGEQGSVEGENGTIDAPVSGNGRVILTVDEGAEVLALYYDRGKENWVEHELVDWEGKKVFFVQDFVKKDEYAGHVLFLCKPAAPGYLLSDLKADNNGWFSDSDENGDRYLLDRLITDLENTHLKGYPNNDGCLVGAIKNYREDGYLSVFGFSRDIDKEILKTEATVSAVKPTLTLTATLDGDKTKFSVGETVTYVVTVTSQSQGATGKVQEKDLQFTVGGKTAEHKKKLDAAGEWDEKTYLVTHVVQAGETAENLKLKATATVTYTYAVPVTGDEQYMKTEVMPYAEGEAYADVQAPIPSVTPTPIPSDDPEDDGDDEPLPSPSVTPSAEPSPTPSSEPIDIPEETVPMAETPEVVELVEEDVPLAETPDEFVEIEEEDVPLADAPSLPQTGLNWLPAILLAVGGVSSSAAGLLLQRKKDEDEE